MKLDFLGATGTVTGSRYLLTSNRGTRILIDCGLFQGPKRIRKRNWEAPSVSVDAIDSIVLTHAHIDHSGYIPRLVERGYQGKVLCTKATKDLCEILLPDCGYLQEEEARHAKKWNYSRYGAPGPLFTREEAEVSLDSFDPLPLHHTVAIGQDLTIRFYRAGHILGAVFVVVESDNTRILFSGDVGRPNDILMRAPEAIPMVDYIVCESTYGDRIHGSMDTESFLADLIQRTVKRGGSVVIPCFAVGRSQAILYLISELKRQLRIPDVPVYLDSPMAINASEIYCRHHDEHRLNDDACHAACHVAVYCRTPEQSKEIGRDGRPKIILSASGMATGGRVLHHLKRCLPDVRNSVLLVGFQAFGTRGRALADEMSTVRIHGEEIEVMAEVSQLHHLSAHADRDELTAWLRTAPQPPKRIYVTHGEQKASMAFAEHIADVLGCPSEVPADGCEVSIP